MVIGACNRPSLKRDMIIRLLAGLVLLASCSSSDYDVSKSIDISADRLAEMKE